MPQNWKTYKLSELCSLIVDCPHSTPKWTDSGVFVLRSHNIRNGKLNYDKPSFTDQENYINRIKRATPQGGDLIITREAPMGEVCMLPDSLECCMGQRMVLLRPNKEVVNNGFLLFVLQSKFVQNQIQAYEGTGSTVSNLRIPVLESLHIPYPPLPEQKAIASILSAIDDKIENNLAMNRTLEEMAMALYKHWFVDFGPFQHQEFIDSELGSIPKGWEVRGLLEVVDLLTGGTPKTSVEEYWNGEIGWVSAKDLGTNGSIYTYDTERTITQKGIDNSAAKILPDDTVVIVARGSVGKLGMIAKSMAINQSCFGLYPKDTLTPSLVYLLTCTLIQRFQSISYGSVFDTITTSSFSSTQVILPPEKVVRELALLIDPMFKTIKENTLENISLSKLRDTLLPKLISGEVRVKDVEQTVANAL